MIAFLPLFLSLILIFSGLFAGIALAFIAREEARSGAKYFAWIKKIILAMVFPLFLLLTKFSIASILLAILFVGAFFLWKKRIFKFDRDIVHYLLFGILLGISSNNPELFQVEGSLVFLYGMPAGTLIKKNKNVLDTIASLTPYGIFLVAGLIGFYLKG